MLSDKFAWDFTPSFFLPHPDPPPKGGGLGGGEGVRWGLPEISLELNQRRIKQKEQKVPGAIWKANDGR